MYDETSSVRILCLEQRPELQLSPKNTCLLPREVSGRPASGSEKVYCFPCTGRSPFIVCLFG